MPLESCLGEIGDHEENACSDLFDGTIAGAALVINNDTLIDFTNATQWANAIAAGEVKVIKGIEGEWPAGSPVNVGNLDNRGPAERKTSIDFAVTLRDQNVSPNNDEFYSDLDGLQHKAVFWFNNEGKIRVTNSEQCIFDHNGPQSGVRERAFYESTIKWKVTTGEVSSTIYDVPAGVFD